MTKYKVTFIYGSWHLWADIENPQAIHDRRGFADLAQLAVNNALDLMPSIGRTHNIASDYTIFEFSTSPSGDSNVARVYEFNILKNE